MHYILKSVYSDTNTSIILGVFADFIFKIIKQFNEKSKTKFLIKEKMQITNCIKQTLDATIADHI